MKRLLLLAFLTISISVVGQNHFLGVKGGINWSDAVDKVADNYFKKGFSGGITYEYRLKKYFLFEADLVYSQSGFENDIMIVDENGQPVYGTGRLVFQFDYVSLPVKAGFIIGNKISGFIFLGIVPSINVSANVIPPDESITFDVSDRITKFDLAGIIELGANFTLVNRLLLFTTLSYQRSITSFSNSEFFGDGVDARLYNITLSVGLKYALGKGEKP